MSGHVERGEGREGYFDALVPYRGLRVRFNGESERVPYDLCECIELGHRIECYCPVCKSRLNPLLQKLKSPLFVVGRVRERGWVMRGLRTKQDVMPMHANTTFV